MAMRIVVMGVSGCGKSTVGSALASALGLPYVEGDRLHPPRNVALMAAGTPLTDADRQGWLEAVAAQLGGAGPQGVVVSCSALKRSYRDRLRASAPDLRLVHLRGSVELLTRRMQLRTGHYMPAGLLQSQLETLEVPGPDESVVEADVAEPVPDIVARLRQRLQPSAASGALS